MMCKISIIIPVYNTEKYLNRCLDSILDQTFKDFEIVIVDDCSPGNCKDIVGEYKKIYSNIKYMRLDKNSGTMIARDAGIKKSEYEYLMFVDPDDYLIDNNVLEELYKECCSDYDIIAFNYVCKSVDGEIFSSPPQNKIIENKVLTSNIASISELFDSTLSESFPSKMIKRNLYNSISIPDKHLIFQEDYLVFIQLLYSAKKVKLITKECFVYFQRENSSTKFNNMSHEKKKKTLSDITYVYSSANEFLKQNNLYERFKNGIISREYRYYDWINNEFFLNTSKEDSRELLSLLSEAFTHVSTYEVILENINKAKTIKDEVYISIIIPVYNTEKYLRRCIDSIINQTFKDMEIIIVDDYSPGNCKEIVEEYQLEHNNIKYIKNTKNMGSAWSRLNGLKSARGKYIHFVDSDDWVSEECYKKIHKYMGNKFEALHFNGYYADDEKSWDIGFQIATHNVLYGKRAAFDDMFFDDKRRRTLWCRVFLRKITLDAACYMPRQWISVADDWILNLFILFNVEKYRSVPDVFYYYYQDNPIAMTAVSEKKANVITGDKLRKTTEQYYTACYTLVHFLKLKRVWHLYKVNWILYILRDIKYHFIDPVKFFESSILDMAENYKDKAVYEIETLFDSAASMSGVLNFIRNNSYMSNDLKEDKLWQLARTNWFYKLTSQIIRPSMLLNSLFSVTDFLDKKCIRFFGLKITIRDGAKNG